MRAIALCAVLLLSLPVFSVVGPAAQESKAQESAAQKSAAQENATLSVKLLWEFDAAG